MRLRTLVLCALSACASLWAASCTGDNPDLTVPPDDASTPREESSTSPDAHLSCTGTLTLCDGTCVDTTATAAHCGRCARSCGLGSSCSSGRCQPVQLVDQLDAPSAIALTTGFAVVNVKDMLVRCAKDGCQSATALWATTGYTLTPGLLTVDATLAYFVGRSDAYPDDDRLYRVDLAVAGVEPFILMATNSLFVPTALATDDREHVFASPYRTERCLKSACNEPLVLEDGAQPVAVGLTPTRYVWTKASSDAILYSCLRPAAGQAYGTECSSSVTKLVPNPAQPTMPSHLVVHDGVAYWTEVGSVGPNSRVRACALTGCGQTPIEIATGEEAIDGLAVDASGAYWTNGTAGTVRACRNLAAGCGASVETLASGATNPGPIAIDGASVFYANRGSGPNTGSLAKVAK